MKKVDVHAHYLPPAYNAMLDRRGLKVLDGGFPRPEWNEEIQFSIMDQLGISYSALSISSPHIHMGDQSETSEVARACNEYGADFARRYPDKIGVMATLPLPSVDAAVDEVRYCQDVIGVDGFGMVTNYEGIYLGSPILDPVMEELNKKETVVLIHPTQPAAIPSGVVEKMPYPFMEFFFDTTRAVLNLVINGTIQKYKNIKWIVPHAGAFLPIVSDRVIPMKHIFDATGTLDIEGSLKSMYFDLAGQSMPKQLGNLRQLVDDTHLLYASDTPFTPMFASQKQKREMDDTLNAKLQDLVYRKNPAVLFPKSI